MESGYSTSERHYCRLGKFNCEKKVQTLIG